MDQLSIVSDVISASGVRHDPAYSISGGELVCTIKRGIQEALYRARMFSALAAERGHASFLIDDQLVGEVLALQQLAARTIRLDDYVDISILCMAALNEIRFLGGKYLRGRMLRDIGADLPRGRA